MEPEVWSTFTRDPRDPQVRALRASDHDRAIVQQVLTDAYADGRLDRAEYDERSEHATRVRTLGDVWPLLGDLVPVQPARTELVHAGPGDLARLAEREWQRKRREAALSWVGASTISTAIWVATSFSSGAFHPYFFWPAIVIALSLLHLVRTVVSRQEIVQAEVRRLERRRERAQRKQRYQPRFPPKPGWRP